MTAVIVFTAKARNTGTKLKNVDRLVFYKYAEKWDIPFKNVAELREKIVEYSKLVFICACGIAVRTIAPFVKNKKDDFAVVVCDEDEMKKLKGTSVLAECIRQFDIEVKMIEIETDLRDTLIEAQKRQRMVNA